mmetsp:Transcript_71554/g.113872  ORF Transcript_71554/g.113872 Transcript_71554/m.113872 type:complete len:473 (-) Transcript_71554:1440-2858(-)|eukprot:CAMPEP_0197072470 /NCGR_PEP_ID=MMETSP1384-20130603/210113_1 /TAXON_ID=29189 /ORGANISM="Ammonia sp." /LENGTH=472 /DNA_ID=CAMNT_0042511289 /DNA_START=40 /DNA_END=1458 /DNA_ORIENTATION=-
MLVRLKSKKSVKDVTEEQKQPELEVYEADKSDYKIVGIIGKGAFAKVYGADCVSKQNRKVAIKVIKLETDDDYGDNADIKPLQISDIQQEAAIMSQMRHENIVSCFSSFVVRDELWLIMPFVSGGSISHILSRSNGDVFKAGIKDERILCCIMKDTLKGLHYMHNQGRIHRDVKGRNILVDGEFGTAMLADFGVSGALLEGGLKKRGRNTMTGTPCWMAPEVMKHQRYNHKADIWSLGITALECAFATTPYTKLKSPMKVMMEIMDGKPPTVDDMDADNKFSKAFKNFVSKCCIKDPQKRLSAQELLSHDFIKKFSDKDPEKDREYMMDNFLKHVQKIEIQECKEHDLPASIKEEKFQVTVQAEGADEEAEDFVFTTSLRDDDIEALQDAANTTDNAESASQSQKKGKFTVTTIKENEDAKIQNNAASPKQSKFTVTEANGGVPATNNQQEAPQSPNTQKKSRFQVTAVNDK